MWKKIHSNRDPKDTLYSEIKKEFKPYFEKAGTKTLSFLERSPRSIFVLMVLLMLLSMVLTFTCFRRPEPKVKQVIIHPIHNGFDEILKAGAQLKETIRLKKLVDSITIKKQLNKTDSVTLVQALDSLQHIHPSLNK